MDKTEIKTIYDLCRYITESLKGKEKSLSFSELIEVLREIDPCFYISASEASHSTMTIRYGIDTTRPSHRSRKYYDDAYICTIKLKCKRTSYEGWHGKIFYKFYYESCISEDPDAVISDLIKVANDKKIIRDQTQKEKSDNFLNLLSEHGFNAEDAVRSFATWIRNNASKEQLSTIKGML